MQVIPAMDHIDSVFATFKDDTSLHPAVRYAVALGKATLNHYYELTDWATVYRVAMGEFYLCYLISACSYFLVLHPQHKLEYFKKLEWMSGLQTHVSSPAPHSYATMVTS